MKVDYYLDQGWMKVYSLRTKVKYYCGELVNMDAKQLKEFFDLKFIIFNFNKMLFILPIVTLLFASKSLFNIFLLVILAFFYPGSEITVLILRQKLKDKSFVKRLTNLVLKGKIHEMKGFTLSIIFIVIFVLLGLGASIYTLVLSCSISNILLLFHIILFSTAVWIIIYRKTIFTLYQDMKK